MSRKYGLSSLVMMFLFLFASHALGAAGSNTVPYLESFESYAPGWDMTNETGWTYGDWDMAAFSLGYVTNGVNATNEYSPYWDFGDPHTNVLAVLGSITNKIHHDRSTAGDVVYVDTLIMAKTREREDPPAITTLPLTTMYFNTNGNMVFYLSYYSAGMYHSWATNDTISFSTGAWSRVSILVDYAIDTSPVMIPFYQIRVNTGPDLTSSGTVISNVFGYSDPNDWLTAPSPTGGSWFMAGYADFAPSADTLQAVQFKGDAVVDDLAVVHYPPGTKVPVMTTDGGPSNVTSSSATLNGEVVEGGDPTMAWLFWGTNDAGTVSNNWNNCEPFGTVGDGLFSTNITGLYANQTYYYRCFGYNVLGTNWSDVTNFTTEPPAVDLASAGSPLYEDGGVATVTVSVDAVSAVDVYVNLGFGGGATYGNDYVNSAGTTQIVVSAYSAGTNFTLTSQFDLLPEGDEDIVVNIDSILSGYGTNGATTNISLVITDLGAPPVVNNDGGPSNLTSGSVTMNGFLVSTGIQPTEAWIFWGTNDAGTVSNNWQYCEPFGIIGSGHMATNISGLWANQTYYYRCLAQNLMGTNWSETTNFTTYPPAVSLSYGGSPFTESAGQASITIAVANASASDVTANLSFSGTAIRFIDLPGGAHDYRTSNPGQTQWVIPAYQPSVVFSLIGMRSAFEPLLEGTETVIINIDSLVNGTNGITNIVTEIFDEDMPTVNNDGGASNVTSSAATLNGMIDIVASDCYIFWGTNDAGTVASNWNNYELFTNQAVGLFSTNLTGLFANQTYYYRTMCSNDYDTSWAPETTNFLCDPPAVSVTAVPGSVPENGGFITVTLSIDAASITDTLVDLSYSGTATEPSDYTGSSTQVLISAYTTSAAPFWMFTVHDGAPGEPEGDETIVISIDSVVGATNGTTNVTVIIVDDDVNPPAVSNDGGPSGVTKSSATMNGMLTSGDVANVYFYWGTNDAVTTNGNWDTFEYFMSATNDQLLSTNLSGLYANGTYYYRCFATNSKGYAWASDTTNFTTLPPAVTLSYGGSPFAENGGMATVTASLDVVSALDVTLNLTFSGSAGYGTDYSNQAGSTQIVVSAFSPNAVFTLLGLDDFLDDNGEQVVINLDSIVNGVNGATTNIIMDITDDDAPPAITNDGGVSNVTSSSATLNALVTTTGSAPASAWIYYGTNDGGTVFANWDANTPFGLVTSGQLLSDPRGSLYASEVYHYRGYVSNAVGATWSTPTVSFLTEPPAVSLSWGTTTFAESNGWLTITASVDVLSVSNITVNFGVAGLAGAANPTDYTNSSTSVQIPAFGNSATLTLYGVDDLDNDDGEGVHVWISSLVSATNGATTNATVTIVDDDEAPPTITNDGGASNITSAAATLNALVTSTGSLPASAWIYYGTNDGGTVIGNWDANASFGIVANDQLLSTPLAGLYASETYYYRGFISNAAGIAWAPSTYSFLTEPPAVALSWGTTNFAESNGWLTITASVDVVSVSNITVNFSFAGTANNPLDYTNSATSIQIPAFANNAVLGLYGVDDVEDDDDETVQVWISSLVNATNGATTNVMTMILDDEEVLYTTNMTPHAWLDVYGKFGFGSYSNADWSDNDLDGSPAWEEYRAGTDPSNSASVFSITVVDDTHTVTWLGGTNMDNYLYFRVYRATNMLDAAPWGPPVTNYPRALGVGGTNVWTDAGAGGLSEVFYRVTAPTNQ